MEGSMQSRRPTGSVAGGGGKGDPRSRKEGFSQATPSQEASSGPSQRSRLPAAWNTIPQPYLAVIGGSSSSSGAEPPTWRSKQANGKECPQIRGFATPVTTGLRMNCISWLYAPNTTGNVKIFINILGIKASSSDNCKNRINSSFY